MSCPGDNPVSFISPPCLSVVVVFIFLFLNWVFPEKPPATTVNLKRYNFVLVEEPCVRPCVSMFTTCCVSHSDFLSSCLSRPQFLCLVCFSLSFLPPCLLFFFFFLSLSSSLSVFAVCFPPCVSLCMSCCRRCGPEKATMRGCGR